MFEEEKAAWLRESLSYCRTVDCYLTKLSVLLVDVKDYSKYTGRPVSAVLRRILDRVGDILSNMDKGTVEKLLASPRFRDLREYDYIILEYAGDVKVLEESKPPTWLVEKGEREEEVISVGAEVSSKKLRRRGGGWKPSTFRLGGFVAGFLAFISLFIPWYESGGGGMVLASATILDFVRQAGVEAMFEPWIVDAVKAVIALIILGSIIAWITSFTETGYWLPSILWLTGLVVFLVSVYMACKPIGGVHYNCVYTSFMGIHVGVSIWGPGALLLATIMNAASKP